MAVLRWETPPERPSDRWTGVADELKENHGKWAVVAEGQKNNTLARNIKQAVYKAFEPAGTFETRSVKTGDTFTVYARFTNGEANVKTTSTRTRTSRKGSTTKSKTTAPAVPAEAKDDESVNAA